MEVGNAVFNCLGTFYVIALTTKWLIFFKLKCFPILELLRRNLDFRIEHEVEVF